MGIVAITEEVWGCMVVKLTEVTKKKKKYTPFKPYTLIEDRGTKLASIFLAGNVKRQT